MAKVKETISCWGCGHDYLYSWKPSELTPGDQLPEQTVAEHQLAAEDRICPDCVEELGGVE